MIIYFVAFAFLSLFSFLEINIAKPADFRIVYTVAGIFLLLMAGLRLETGYDIDQYHTIFDLANNTNYHEFLLEPGSFLIILLMHALSLGFQSYLIVYAFFSVSLKLSFFEKYVPYIFVGLLVYFPIGFMINDMGQIRHGLAIAIVLIAFGYLFADNYKLFFFYATIAILFHVSAFIVLPVYFFVKRTFKPQYLIISILLLTPLLFFDSRSIFLSFLDFVPIPTIKSKATLYLYSEEFGKPLGFNISYILRVIIFAFLLLIRKKGIEKFKFYDKLIWLYFYGIMLYIVFNSVSEFAIRTTTYFKTLDSVILPCLITFGSSRAQKTLIWGLIVLYAFYSMFKLLYDPVSRPAFVPYRSILSPS